VEIARQEHRVVMRDSKDPDGPRLMFAAANWRAFLADLRTADFD
jgi:hypothetical protein